VGSSRNKALATASTEIAGWVNKLAECIHNLAQGSTNREEISFGDMLKELSKYQPNISNLNGIEFEKKAKGLVKESRTIDAWRGSWARERVVKDG
jgi:hypothetical protein